MFLDKNNNFTRPFWTPEYEGMDGCQISKGLWNNSVYSQCSSSALSVFENVEENAGHLKCVRLLLRRN